MLIELDDDKISILKKVNQYGIVPLFIELDNGYFIKTGDLFKIIDELTAELSREQEIMGDYVQNVDNEYCENKDKIYLNDLEKEILDELSRWTDGTGWNIEQDHVDKDELFGQMQDTINELKKNNEDIEDYKENYKPIGNESGWDLAFTYQKEMENERKFLEQKGLWDEYKEKHWKVGK